MPLDEAALWRAVGLGEDSQLEFKEVEFRGGRLAAPRRDAIADEIAAFANAGGGRLILGIRDDRSAQALTPDQLDTLITLVGKVCDSIRPPIAYEAHRVAHPHEPGRGVLVVDVPPTPATQVVAGTGIHSLDRDLWRRYASSRPGESDESRLAKLTFVRKDAAGALRATVGGVLLAAADPREWLPNAYIQAVRYQGRRMDRSRQLDAQDLDGPLDAQIRGAASFVARNQRVAAHKSSERREAPEYSPRAVFEALVNAVVHRDYNIAGSHIRLFMFDDRLELHSPGALADSMTIEDLRDTHCTRNPLLADRLGQCPVENAVGACERDFFIEQRGEGIRTIEEETFALAGRTATFELLGGRELRLTLPAAPLRGASACSTIGGRLAERP